MTTVGKFDFAKYDVGGSNAKSGDGKLTGAELLKAQRDGWAVWARCTRHDYIEPATSRVLKSDNYARSWYDEDGKQAGSMFISDGLVVNRGIYKNGKKVKDIEYEYDSVGNVISEVHSYDGRIKIGEGSFEREKECQVFASLDPVTGKIIEMKKVITEDGTNKGLVYITRYDADGHEISGFWDETKEATRNLSRVIGNLFKRVFS